MHTCNILLVVLAVIFEQYWRKTAHISISCKLPPQSSNLSLRLKTSNIRGRQTKGGLFQVGWCGFSVIFCFRDSNWMFTSVKNKKRWGSFGHFNLALTNLRLWVGISNPNPFVAKAFSEMFIRVFITHTLSFITPGPCHYNLFTPGSSFWATGLAHIGCKQISSPTAAKLSSPSPNSSQLV